MPMYTVYVTETRSYDVTYHIEADTLQEALWKAETGETESEDETQFNGVSDRYVSEGHLSEDQSPTA